MFRIVRHWKGGLYTVIGEATHTETGEKLVVYADARGVLHARPSEMFLGTVEGPRFKDAEPGGGRVMTIEARRPEEGDVYRHTRTGNEWTVTAVFDYEVLIDNGRGVSMHWPLGEFVEAWEFVGIGGIVLDESTDHKGHHTTGLRQPH